MDVFVIDFPGQEEEGQVGKVNGEEESVAVLGGISLDTPSQNFARALILLASAVYGTNFAVVKLLDEQMPFEVSAALRFCLAAAVTSALVLKGEQKAVAVSKEVRDEQSSATWGGMEIGAWYCLGYLCQAVGLQTADASKVRMASVFATTRYYVHGILFVRTSPSRLTFSLVTSFCHTIERFLQCSGGHRGSTPRQSLER